MSNLNNHSCNTDRASYLVPATTPAKRAREENTESPMDTAARDAEGARLSQQFALQGIEYDEKDKTLFCAMCQASQDAARVPLTVSTEAVLFHCNSRVHLVAYEKVHAEELKEWFPVELHGYRMLLDHHCVYPRTLFGPGRLLMDETIANGMLIAEDVCGGVALLPRHRYIVVELVLSSSRAFTLPRADEDKEGDLQELARCTIEPLASLPTHIKVDGFRRSQVVPAERTAIGCYYANTRLPPYNGGVTEEKSGNTHLRFDKMLDSVNAAIASELSMRQQREKDVSTADASNA